MFVIKTEDQGGLHYKLNIFRKLYQLVDITNAISSMQHEAGAHCANWFALELKSPQKKPKCLKK